MPDLLLRRLAHLALICCILFLTTLIGWGSFAYMAWSARHLSAELNGLTTDRNQLVAERDEARSNFDQISRPLGDLKQLEAKLEASRAEHDRAVELSEKRSELAAAKGEVRALIKRIKDVSQTGSIPQPEPKRN